MPSLLGGSSSRSSGGSLLGGSGTSVGSVGSGSSSISPLMMMAAQRQREEEDSGGGILGLLGNAWEGVVGLGGGIAGLIGAGVHDLGQIAGHVIPGEQNLGIVNDTDPDQGKLAQILTGAIGFDEEGEFHPMDETAIAGDLWKRWGPLGPGGKPASETFESMYENPVSFLLDAASVASLGAGASAKVGGRLLANKGVGLLDEGSTALRTLEELGTNVAPRTARAASIRTGLEEAGLGNPLMRSLLPKATHKLVQGEGLIPTTTAYNPLYRAALNPVRKAMTESLDDFAARGGLAEEAVKKMPAALQGLAEVDQVDTILDAAKKLDMTRIEKPRFATLNVKQRSMQMVAEMTGRHRIDRDAAMKPVADLIESYGRRDPDILDPEGGFADKLMGADVNIENLDRSQFAIRQGLGETGPRVAMAGGDAAEMGGGVTTAVRSATKPLDVETPILKKSAPLIERLQALKERYVAQRGTLEEGGMPDVDGEIDAIDMWIEGLEDGLARRARQQDTTMPDVDDQTLLMDELRIHDLEGLIDGFEGLGLSPRAAMDRNFRTVQAIHGRDFNWDTGDFEGGPDLRELHDAFRQADVPQPVYFPHMDATNMRSSDFFSNKRTVGANLMARDPHNKQMKLALLKDGKLSKDVKEVYKRRAARQSKESQTFEVWDTVTKRFGTELADPNMKPPGYDLVAPDILFINYRTRTNFIQAIDDNLVKGMTKDRAIAKAMEDTLKQNRDTVAKLHEAGDIKVYAVPHAVIENLHAAAKWAPAFGGKNVSLFFDTYQNLWRGLTLTASPRWVVNNVLGNIAFGAMQGIRTADVMRIGTEKFRVLMANWWRRNMPSSKKGQTAQLRKDSLAGQTERLMAENNVSAGPGYIGSYNEMTSQHLSPAAMETKMGKLIMATRETRTAQGMMKAGGMMKALNATIEDTYRSASFLAASEKAVGMGAIRRTGRSFTRSKERIDSIMEKGYSETTARQAINEMHHFFGEYGKMHPFERHVIRRWLFPFWGFYRHSSKLLLTFPFTDPLKAKVIEGFARVNQEMLDQHGERPDWLEWAIPMGGDEFLTTRGMNPFSGVAEGLPGALNMLGPLQKIALEQATGESTFTGEEFTDRDVFTPFGSDQKFRIEYDEDGKPIWPPVPVEKVAPSFLTALASTVPQLEMLKDLMAGGTTYDTASVADAFQQMMGDAGEATALDPETGKPYSEVSLAEILSKFGGMPIAQYSLADYQQRLLEDQQAAIQQAYERMAVEMGA